VLVAAAVAAAAVATVATAADVVAVDVYVLLLLFCTGVSESPSLVLFGCMIRWSENTVCTSW
jgi:hypothetical protein